MPYRRQAREILFDWGQVELELRHVPADTPQATVLHASRDRLQHEYRSVTDEYQRVIADVIRTPHPRLKSFSLLSPDVPRRRAGVAS